MTAYELFKSGMDTYAIAEAMGWDEARAYAHLHYERSAALGLPCEGRKRLSPSVGSDAWWEQRNAMGIIVANNRLGKRRIAA